MTAPSPSGCPPRPPRTCVKALHGHSSRVLVGMRPSAGTDRLAADSPGIGVGGPACKQITCHSSALANNRACRRGCPNAWSRCRSHQLLQPGCQRAPARDQGRNPRDLARGMGHQLGDEHDQDEGPTPPVPRIQRGGCRHKDLRLGCVPRPVACQSSTLCRSVSLRRVSPISSSLLWSLRRSSEAKGRLKKIWTRFSNSRRATR